MDEKSPTLPETVDIGALAELFGLTSRQARNILEGAGVRAVARGRWPLTASIRGALAKARERNEPNTLTLARARAVNAQARGRELQIARAERELIALSEFELAFDVVLRAVVDELDGAPARISRDAGMQRSIRADLDAARLRMVEKISEAAAALRSGDLPNDDPDDDAPARPARRGATGRKARPATRPARRP